MPAYAAVGVAALSLLVVDSVVAGTRGSDHLGMPSSGVPVHSGVINVQHDARSLDVASGHGKIWVLTSRGSGPGAHKFVERIDPQTQSLVSSIRVPGPSAHLFYGVGRVWVTGGDPASITAIDPTTDRTTSISLSGGTIESMAFARGTAYAAVIGRDEVLAIRAGRRLRVTSIEELGGPRAVVALRHAIEVTNREENLVPVILPGADTTFLAELDLGRPIFAAAGPRSAWVRRGRLLVLESPGADDHVVRKYIPLVAPARDVVMTPQGGGYVTLSSRGGRRSPNLLYFSHAALQAKHSRPTAVHRGSEVRNVALDPAGGVVFTDKAGRLRRWVPRVKSLR